MEDNNYFKKSLSGEFNNIRYCFCTRTGGVSAGVYSSLNCGFGSSDAKSNIEKNRTRALEELGVSGARLVTCNQKHTAKAIVIESQPFVDEIPKADAMVTNQTGLALGILTADCVPIVLADPTTNIIAAIHAGWRGALLGIIESTIHLMQETGAFLANTHAIIGPCICQQSYEVGVEFKHRFIERDPLNRRFFTVNKVSGKSHFSLPDYVLHRLECNEVKQISSVGLDTYANEEMFFSYRRSKKKNERDFGRGISLIAISG